MMPMTRYRAASIHLGISLLVGAILFALFWFVWYRAPLFAAVGGIEVFLLLLVVDVVLGPVMTLIVFNPAKKSLKFDLSVIAIVQLAALVYGVSMLLAARPVYLASIGNQFDVVHANDVEDIDMNAAGMTMRPMWGPLWTGTRKPTDAVGQERLAFAMVDGGLAVLPQYYQPLENMRDEILRNAQPIATLKKFNPGEDSAIDRWLEKHGMKPDQVVFQRLKAREKDMAVILDAKTAVVIGIAPFTPNKWQAPYKQ
jgi:hypothetical protein